MSENHKIPIKTIISDLGNVVMFFDWSIAYERFRPYCATLLPEVKHATERYPFLADFECGKISSEELYANMSDLLKMRLPFETFAQIWSDIFTPNTAMIDFFKNISTEVRLVLLSNTNELHYSFIRKHFPDALSMFEDRVVLSYEAGCIKPDKRIYRNALTKAGCNPEECIYIDDIKEYADAAQSLGIHGIHYTSHDAFTVASTRFSWSASS